MKVLTSEGTDESGKTTQMKLIEKYLPDMGNTAEMLLYAASRAELVEKVIKPGLKNRMFGVETVNF